MRHGASALVGSRTTRIYCAPDCSAAGRIAERNLVAFAGANEALRQGYRPCKLCLRDAGRAGERKAPLRAEAPR